MGLKVGIYSTPWVTSYAGYIGGSADNAEGTWESPTNRVRLNGQYPFAENDANWHHKAKVGPDMVAQMYAALE